jgi:recombination protein U
MKYPGGVVSKNKSIVNYANRGMNFEADINITNKYYLDEDIAVIYKKPTPITINKVSYPSRANAVITEARFKTPSTTDYNGIYKGRYIDFEAKETNLHYFPLANIHDHQIVHLKKIIKHGGIGFILVNFNKLNKIFYLDGNCLFDFINKNDRKSIPIEYFEEYGYEIKVKFNPSIIRIIDTIIFYNISYRIYFN